MGSASYAPEHDALVWKIKSFPGNKVGVFSMISMYQNVVCYWQQLKDTSCSLASYICLTLVFNL